MCPMCEKPIQLLDDIESECDSSEDDEDRMVEELEKKAREAKGMNDVAICMHAWLNHEASFLERKKMGLKFEGMNTSELGYPRRLRQSSPGFERCRASAEAASSQTVVVQENEDNRDEIRVDTCA